MMWRRKIFNIVAIVDVDVQSLENLVGNKNRTKMPIYSKKKRKKCHQTRNSRKK